MDALKTRTQAYGRWAKLRDGMFRPTHHVGVRRLAEAGTGGDIDQIRLLLHPGVAVVVDRGDGDRSGVRVVHGVEDASALLIHGLAAEPGVVVEERSVNSQAGLMVSRSGAPFAAIAVDFTGALVSLVWVRLNPAGLRHWNTV